MPMWSVLAKKKHCLSQSNKWEIAHLIIMWQVSILFMMMASVLVI